MEKISFKIIIAEDQELFRKGIVMVLNKMNGISVIGEASNGKDLLTLLNSKNPDLIFMDINMPIMNGIETTIEALKIRPYLKIVALSMFDDKIFLQQMIDAGAVGFLLKNSSVSEFENAINKIKEGKYCFSETLLSRLAIRSIDQPFYENNDLNISVRELEILQLIAKGYSNEEIASTLNISKRTVDGHKSNLISKTGSKNMIDLIILAIKKGLVKI